MFRRATRSKQSRLRRKVVEALRTVSDVALDCSVYDLGCVYKVDIDADGQVARRMTLTGRGHPRALAFVEELRGLLEEIDGVNRVEVNLVWGPPRSAARMGDQARAGLAVSG